MAGVFVSYRRSDSAGHTGRLADYLGQELEDQALFRDIEKIQAGEDFVEVLERAVAACSVMLVVIGPQWARAETPDGKRRLKQPGDFVRMEIETALARGVRVIPVLVGDATMPEAEDLPESMAPLLRRHAQVISDRRWAYDLGELLEILKKVPGVSFRQREVAQPQAVPVPAAQAPAAPVKGGMATWLKVLIGGVTLLAVAVVLAIILIPAAGPQPGAAPAGSASVSSAPAASASISSGVRTSISGAWRVVELQCECEERDMAWYFTQTGNKLVAVAGSAVEPSLLPPPRPNQKHADSEYNDLRGEGKIDGQGVTIKLRNPDTSSVTIWVARVSPDGKSIAGKMNVEGDPDQFDFTLRRD